MEPENASQARCARGAKPQRRDHSQEANTANRSAKSAHQPRGAKASMPRTTGRRASAVRTRVSSMAPVLAGLGQRLALGELLAGAAEAALPLAVGREGRLEGGGIEVRPEFVGEVELRVRELPQEEV